MVKKITIIVPDEQFSKFPNEINMCKISNWNYGYTDESLGKFEKAKRLLRRFLMSAIDNKQNFEDYEKMFKEYKNEANKLEKLQFSFFDLSNVNIYTLDEITFKHLKIELKILQEQIDKQKEVVKSVKWKRDKYEKWHGKLSVY